MLEHEIPEISKTIDRIIETRRPLIRTKISAELQTLQNQEPTRIQTNFQNNLISIKQSLLNIMKKYITKRESYILQGFLKSSVGTFFFSNTSKIPEAITKENESYINTFTNTDADKYSLAIYQQIITIINNITDLDSAKKSAADISSLLSEETSVKTPTLASYAQKTNEYLKKILTTEYYQRDYLQQLDSRVGMEINHLNLTIVNFVNIEISKILDDILNNNEKLKIYYNYLTNLRNAHDSLTRTQTELHSIQEKMQDKNYYSEARNEISDGQNPWHPPQEINETEVSTLATSLQQADTLKLTTCRSDLTLAQNNYNTQKQIAMTYAIHNNLDRKFVILAENNHTLTQLIMTFTEGTFIQALCDKLEETYLPKASIENLSTTTSPRF